MSFAYKLELDVDNDGSWSQDESAFFYGATIERGRKDALGNIPPGQMTLTLNNRDGRYSPLNSVISNLDHDIPVRLYVAWTTPAVTNIHENPAAQTNADGYAAVGGAGAPSRVATDSWTGGACISRPLRNNGEGWVEKKVDGTRFAVSASTAYRWSEKLKTSGGDLPVDISIRWFTSGDVFISEDAVTVTVTDDWQHFSVSATSPGTAAKAELQGILTDDEGPHTTLSDASFFYQASAARPYVDGRQPGCTWSGTADASQSSRSANPDLLLFQGILYDFKLATDNKRHVATIVCRDQLESVGREVILLGNIVRKGVGLCLQRVIERVEGELISNPGVEWSIASPSNPGTGWSNLGGGSGFNLNEVANLAGADKVFEGDDYIEAVNDGLAAGEGVRYDATTDIAATGKYEASIYARAESGTVVVKFEFLRDAVVEATKTVTLTTTHQRITLSIDFSTLGTNRYFDIKTNVTSSVDFFATPLHCVKLVDSIPRDFDAGTGTAELINAYHERAGHLIDDLVRTEPRGLMFIKAKTLAEGDAIAFRDLNSRDSPAPRAVYGDGDGLLGFEAVKGFGFSLDAVDRVTSATVTSRGSIEEITTQMVGWTLDPLRDTTTGDFFFARYTQTLSRVKITEKGGAINRTLNYGAGHDIDVDTGASAVGIDIRGNAFDYTGEFSYVRKVAASDKRRRQITVPMPLQATQSSAMDTEAQRLLDKYKNKVVRGPLVLKGQEPPAADDLELITAHQLDAEINDPIVLRAKFQDSSPGVDKTMFIEGISHVIARKKLPRTTFHLEEA